MHAHSGRLAHTPPPQASSLAPLLCCPSLSGRGVRMRCILQGTGNTLADAGRQACPADGAAHARPPPPLLPTPPSTRAGAV